MFDCIHERDVHSLDYITDDGQCVLQEKKNSCTESNKILSLSHDVCDTTVATEARNKKDYQNNAKAGIVNFELRKRREEHYGIPIENIFFLNPAL